MSSRPRFQSIQSFMDWGCFCSGVYPNARKIGVASSTNLACVPSWSSSSLVKSTRSGASTRSVSQSYAASGRGDAAGRPVVAMAVQDRASAQRRRLVPVLLREELAQMEGLLRETLGVLVRIRQL